VRVTVSINADIPSKHIRFEKKIKPKATEASCFNGFWLLGMQATETGLMF